MQDDISTDHWYSEEAATFGDRMAGAREATGMSQKDLAKRLGVKLKTISAWENDVSEPRSNKLQMMAGVLNVSLMWLLNGQGDGLEAPSEDVELSPDCKEILVELRELRAKMVRMVDRMGVLEKKLRTHLERDQA